MGRKLSWRQRHARIAQALFEIGNALVVAALLAVLHGAHRVEVGAAAAVAAGADAIEIGIPFSDPVMDGPVIQQASQMALDQGATPVSVLHEARSLDVGIPLAVMLYYNTVHHAGHERFAASLRDAGVVACIVPDLPLEEAGPWCVAADAAGVETIMLAAPTAPDDRLPRVCARARGFVYSVGLLGVTGERAQLAGTAVWPPPPPMRPSAHRPVRVGSLGRGLAAASGSPTWRLGSLPWACSHTWNAWAWRP